MKFRRRAPAILITASIAVIASITWVATSLVGDMLASAETGSFRLMRDVLSSLLKSTEDKALVRAEIVSAMPAVRTAFINRDRPKLLAECKDVFKEQEEKYGLDQAQFHVPPGTSFLRLHKPDKFDDDQTSYRPMLTEVNQAKVLRKGIAITRSGPIISGIVPMADDTGKHVGSFEMGLELAPMLDKIKQAYGLEAAVFIDEKMLREIAVDLSGDVMSPQNRVGKYIRFHATHPDLVRALVQDGDINITQPANYQRTVLGAPWGVQLVPMYNYANKQVGVYALGMDFSETRASQGRSRIWLLLAGLFGVVALAGMILIVIRGTLLAPLAALNARMAALAIGDASKEADPPDAYCDELAELAENYERLRTKRAS